MIAAIVILYFPDKKLLARLLASLGGQVQKIYLIDNTPPDESTSYLDLDLDLDLDYHSLGDNLGIAKAQNFGCKLAIKDGFERVLLLDQDSALSDRMVDGLLKASSNLECMGNKVAAVGPLFCDEKTGVYAAAAVHGMFRVKNTLLDPTMTEPVKADYIIASGSLIRVDVFESVGFMMEELFIDWVDIEWGLRAKSKSYSSYIIPSVLMKHSIGDGNIKILGRQISLHSHIRNFYIVRNAAYLIRKNYMGWTWRFVTLLRIPQFIVAYSWFSESKTSNFISLLRALLDGMRCRLGKAKV